jgi:hypothetical protein
MAEYVVLALVIFFVSEWIELPNEWLRYTVSTLFIVIYLCYAAWREKIDVKGLVGHILKRGRR